jgi:hypothetical protein
MNLNRPGWLNQYVAFRTAHPFPEQLPSTGVRVLEEGMVHHELDEAIYYFIQPTGLLYGFPVGLPFPADGYQDAAGLDPGERAQLIFLDALFACLVADRHFLLQGLTDERQHFPPALQIAQGFFVPAPLSAGLGGRLLPGRLAAWLGGDAPARLERALLRRLGRGKELHLPGFYYNSFLFLDLYHCMDWQRRMLMEPDQAESHRGVLRGLQVDQRRLLIRLMIAAAAVSGEIVPAERRLIQWFLRSSNLPGADQGLLRAELGRGLRLEEVEVPAYPWLVRRFMLEAVMMTMLVDRDLSTQEEAFLHQVVERLELWKEELNQSLMALEVFLLNQEDRLLILKDRHFVFNLGENLRRQAAEAVRRNLGRVVREIRETHELYNLLMKSTLAPLTAEERRKVRAQLLDILKTIPALTIFALPGGALLLPVLIRLLPFNLLPSSFED